MRTGTPIEATTPPAGRRDSAGPGRSRPDATRLRSPLQYVAAAAAVVAGGAHLVVTEDTWHDARYLGVLFVLIQIACAALAVLLYARDTPRVWRATALTGALAILGYVFSRAVGLPRLHDDDVGNWTEPLGLLAVSAEALMCLLAVVALVRHRHPVAGGDRRAPSWRALLGGALALQLGVAGLFSAAQAEAGPASHPGAGTSHSASGMAGMAMASTGTTGAGYWQRVGGAYHPTGRTRTYYIGADEVVWDYAPAGRNEITGEPFDDVADTYVKSGPGRIGSRYLKCLYRGYTDGSFTHLAPRPAGQTYLGLVGPVIHAEVGDSITVVFRNSCRIPASVHPHGVFYAKASEGAPYADNTSGVDTTDDAVPTGGRHTYTWLVPDRAGPGPHDGSSVMWMYHSHTDEVSDVYAGLMGFMVITGRGLARGDGTPKDVDREVFELFSVMNENNSPYLTTNVHRFAGRPFADPDDEDFQESNLMHSVNGYVFGNQPMLTLHTGQRVRWYVMSMGTEVDLHTPHWHGNDVVVGGMRMDVVSLLPASMVVADMVPDDPGVWLFHCHVADHLTAGMITRYRVVT